METIISSVQSFSSYVVPMVILLGLLIFVHELGHFLVAKYFNVRVETFSLGFGPKLFKFKRGDTVYAVSAIPLGGYVKMFGDDPTADISAADRQFSFTHKPVGQRIAVVLAGPLMNFFFAILLFMSIALIGEPTISPVIGDVVEHTPAFDMGFRSGDLVKTVNSTPVLSWDDVQKQVEHQGGQSMRLDVQREDGKAETLNVTPKLVPNPSVMSWDGSIGEIDGLSPSSRASVVGVMSPKSAAAQAGLKTGDLVTAVNGVKVTKWRTFLSEVSQSPAGQPLKLTVEHGNFDPVPPKTSVVADVSIETTAAAGLNGVPALAALGVEFPELYLAEIVKNSPAAKAGLEKGDRVLSINGQAVTSFDQIAGMIRSFGTHKDAPATAAATAKDSGPNPLEILVDRNGEQKKVSVVPNVRSHMSQHGREESQFEIGIHPMIIEAAPQTFKWSTTSPVVALERGISQTLKWSGLTVLSFVRLFQGKVSAKNIGGFLSIGQVAKTSWQVGPAQFLMAMAFISINLFVLNLLPVPVLDGGHLVFYSIELIKGAPLSMRKMEIAQQVGLALLLGLMVFALFNDVSRLIGNG